MILRGDRQSEKTLGLDEQSIKPEFRDYYGNPLERGLYFSTHELGKDIYFVNLGDDKKTFLADCHEASLVVTQQLAKTLIKLNSPFRNIEFAASKLNSSEQKAILKFLEIIVYNKT